MVRPNVADYADRILPLMRLHLPEVVNALIGGGLVNVGWEKISVELTLRIFLGNVNHGRNRRSPGPILATVGIKAIRDDVDVPIQTWEAPPCGELFHFMGCCR